MQEVSEDQLLPWIWKWIHWRYVLLLVCRSIPLWYLPDQLGWGSLFASRVWWDLHVSCGEMTLTFIHIDTCLYRAFFGILFGIVSVSQGSAFAPNYAKARLSAKRIFALVDLVPTIDSFSEEGDKPVCDHVIHYCPHVHWSLHRLKLMDKCHWRKWSLSIQLDPMYLYCKDWICQWSQVKR